jgi:hypothetical protein
LAGIPPSHGKNTSSILVGVTMFCRAQQQSAFLAMFADEDSLVEVMT